MSNAYTDMAEEPNEIMMKSLNNNAADDLDSRAQIAQLTNIVQITAMTVNNQSEQMGLLVSKVNGNTQRIVALEDWKAHEESTRTVTRQQRRRISKACKDRVSFLLHIRYDQDGKITPESRLAQELYYQSFISKLYGDARKKSKLGDSNDETLRADFDEVIEYIDSWTPEGYGVDGWKTEADKRRRIREGNGH